MLGDSQLKRALLSSWYVLETKKKEKKRAIKLFSYHAERKKTVDRVMEFRDSNFTQVCIFVCDCAFVCMIYWFSSLGGLFLFKGQLLKSIPCIGFISGMTIDYVFPNCLGWAQMCQALESHCDQTMTFYVLCIRHKSLNSN